MMPQESPMQSKRLSHAKLSRKFRLDGAYSRSPRFSNAAHLIDEPSTGDLRISAPIFPIGCEGRVRIWIVEWILQEMNVCRL